MMNHVVTVILLIGIASLATCASHVITPRDDTESPTERSGVVLYTDHGTGCQYVGSPFGGVTPRHWTLADELPDGGAP